MKGVAIVMLGILFGVPLSFLDRLSGLVCIVGLAAAGILTIWTELS